MNRDVPLNRWILCFLLCLGTIPAAQAITNPTPQRAYVSLSGSDANNCGPSAPCRTFQAALAQVNPNGEVLVLDSGAYGTMTITQGVTIVAPPGIYAGISVFSGDGITVDAAGAKVTLDGITVNGQGGGNGINALNVATLRIQNCVVSNMAGNGIQLKSANAKVYVSNTHVRENGAGGASGIYLEGTQSALLENVHAEGNGYGIFARSGPIVAVRDSIAIGNNNAGFTVEATIADTTMSIEKSISMHNNGNGVSINVASGQHGRTTVSDSQIEGNSAGGIVDSGAAGGGTLTVQSSKIRWNGSFVVGPGIGYGAASGETRHAMFADNIIDGNGYYGIWLTGPTTLSAVFTKNIVTNNLWGIYTAWQGGGFSDFPAKLTRGDGTIGNNYQFDNSSNNGAASAFTPLSGF